MLFVDTEESKYDELMTYVKIPAKCYPMLNADNTRVEVLAQIWSCTLKVNITSEDMSQHFNNISKVTNFPKLRSFQYRLLHNAIVLNKQLKIWKVVESDLCSNCHKEIESKIHFFAECDSAKTIWHSIAAYIEHRFDLDIVINTANIMFNKICVKPDHVANLLCLITKQTMYANRCIKKSTTVQEVKAKIEKIKDYELHNAKRAGKIKRHKEKWNETGVIYVEDHFSNIH